MATQDESATPSGREQFAAVRKSVLLSPRWRQLGKAATDVYLGLALAAECGAGIVWRPADQLAVELGYTLRGVRKALAELDDAGLIELVERGRRARASRYNLSVSVNGGSPKVPVSVNGDSVNGGSPKDVTVNGGSVEGNHGSVKGNDGSSEQPRPQLANE